jgi:N-acetylglucosaminyldiphosphoundecaprenol N-acetyl-beta-D-mannosaminyltransferase
MATAVTRAHVLGFEVDRLDLDATVERCRDLLSRSERVHHVSLNAAKLVRARRDARLAAVLASADIVSADGQAVVWASRLLGDTLPQRVAGIDLMYRLLQAAEDDRRAVFFLGGEREILAAAIDRVRSEHPRLRVEGHHGYFDEADARRVCDAVNESAAEILFVAMSSPKKEYWVHEHRAQLATPLIVGVGGAVDILAGATRRAPLWMQQAGLEWAFRLLQEPRRLWRRYLVTNMRFAGLLLAELVRRKATHAAMARGGRAAR